MMPYLAHSRPGPQGLLQGLFLLRVAESDRSAAARWDSTSLARAETSPPMQQTSKEALDGRSGVLAGARGWIITDGKAGMDVQARGVADALGLAYEMKRVGPTGI